MKKTSLLLAITTLSCGALFAGDAPNGLNRDYWNNHTSGINGVRSNIEKKVAPTGSDIIESFEAVSWTDHNNKINFAEKYGQVVYGFIVPDESGEYIFWIAADDMGELKLSTDDNAKNLKSIAKTSVWTAPKQFDKKPEQKSKPVKLEAGKKYYVEVMMYEGGGGDNLSVAWTKPGKDQSKPTEVIPGKNLVPAKAVQPTKPAEAQK